MTGRPHFECAFSFPSFPTKNWTPGFDLITDPILKKNLKIFYNNQDGYCSGMQAWQTGNTYQLMARLMIEANDPYSAISRYFLDLKADALKLKNDRISYAFAESMIFINQN